VTYNGFESSRFVMVKKKDLPLPEVREFIESCESSWDLAQAIDERHSRYIAVGRLYDKSRRINLSLNFIIAIFFGFSLGRYFNILSQIPLFVFILVQMVYWRFSILRPAKPFFDAARLGIDRRGLNGYLLSRDFDDHLFALEERLRIRKSESP